jgi:lysophospholipase L1-like esterase
MFLVRGMTLRLFCLRIRAGIFVLALIGLVSPALADPNLWTKEIEGFIAEDGRHPMVRNPVLFVGSSSIVKWTTLARDFPGIPVINRGFGGSELADSVFYADRIIMPHQPRIVVLYAGENDLWAGKTPEKVLSDFKAFRLKLQRNMPNVRIFFLSIKESPSRTRIRADVLRTNELIAAECGAGRNCLYVDVATPMLDKDGKPRPELFVADQLHMNHAGYAIWTAVLAPLLKP